MADKEFVYIAIIKTHRANGDNHTDYRETRYPTLSGADDQNLDGARKDQSLMISRLIGMIRRFISLPASKEIVDAVSDQ